jgi:hypothetical protein
MESFTATEAVIGGNLQHLNRNSIKQILLTERYAVKVEQQGFLPALELKYFK